MSEATIEMNEDTKAIIRRIVHKKRKQVNVTSDEPSGSIYGSWKFPVREAKKAEPEEMQRKNRIFDEEAFVKMWENIPKDVKEAEEMSKRREEIEVPELPSEIAENAAKFLARAISCQEKLERFKTGAGLLYNSRKINNVMDSLYDICDDEDVTMKDIFNILKYFLQEEKKKNRMTLSQKIKAWKEMSERRWWIKFFYKKEEEKRKGGKNHE